MAVTGRQVQAYTARRLDRLLSMQNDGALKAALAQLRRGVGHVPGELPELWGTFLSELPEEMCSKDGRPTRAEWAIYTALTLFALHQQGRNPQEEPMNVQGATLGKAVRRLAAPGKDDSFERVRKRFNIAATAMDVQEAAQHLRSIVQLLRAQGIALDYPQLAADLYAYQYPEQQASVRLRWGQDFYFAPEQEKQEDGKDDSNA